jgi:putative transposase
VDYFLPSMKRKPYPTDLTDSQWELIEPLIPPAKTKPRTVPEREIINALLYLQKTGCQWRMLPNDFPAWTAVRYQFDCWSQAGIWQRINAHLSQLIREQEGHEPDPSLAVLDSQSVKTSATGGPVGYDGGKKNQGSEAEYFGR